MAPTPIAPQAELLTVEQLAALLAIGKRTLWRYARSGRAPAPIKIGAVVRWRRAEVMTWIEAGCPRTRTIGR